MDGELIPMQQSTLAQITDPARRSMRYGTNGSAGDNVEISTGRSNREGKGSNTPDSTVTLQPTAKPTLEAENNVEQSTATLYLFC